VSAPAATGGNRLRWRQLPKQVRDAVESAAGAPVRSETSQPGGFSPGLASVLHLADSRSVFVKAAGRSRNPDSPKLHRTEGQVLAALPAAAPAPRLLWRYDDGDWVALMTEVVDGVPPAQPWVRPELERFLAAAGALAADLTAAGMDVPLVQDSHASVFTGWRHLAGDGDVGWLEPWARRRLKALAALEERWPAGAAGASLLHGDLRADNVLLTDERVVVVDWPHACVGAGWLDLLFAMPSIAMHGGGPPEALWRRYPPARGADPEAVTAVLAALTGYFLAQSRRPAPPNLPRVRAFQRAQGEAALAWLRSRGIPGG
jgi:aminoglycoside phosphotransferase (APT) family kinase protein